MPLHVADGHERERGTVLALDPERRAERAPLHTAISLAQPALSRLRARRDTECSGRMKTAHHLRERHLLVPVALREKNRRHQMSDVRQMEQSQRANLDVPERTETPDDVVNDEAMLAPFLRIAEQLRRAQHGTRTC